MSFNFTQETTSKCLSKAKVIFLPLIMLLLALDVSAQCPLFSNELHYDNTGADANERIEIGGEAGTSMNGWSVVFYNGFDGTSIATVNLTGNLPAAQCTISGVPISFRVIDVLSETTFSFQNGSPDGWALVNGTTVVEFYSYEGTFTATNGPANGLQSTDIGVFEDGNGATTGSIQRTSTSTWAVNASTNTFGACNTSQYGPPCGSNPVVTLSLNKTEGSEANTTVVTATANATAPVSGAQTVTLAITGTNITGGDYTLSSTTITIPNGATSGSVTFTVVNDAVAENTETAVFTISNPTSGITLGATVSRNFTIFDNDAPLATRCLVFSNEIHYDNSGTDANERIELAGDAGTSLTGWSVYLYESGGTVYGTANLSGSIPNTGTCSVSGRTIGLTVLDIPALTGQSIQGGPADGWALVYNGTVVEFFSYEGTILATAGPALGMTSVDIGASEDGTGTSNGSIQRTGPNTWVTSASTNTFGSCNSTQYVTPCSTTPSVNLTLSVYEGTEAAGTVVQVIATTNSAVVGNQTVNLAITGTNVTGTDYTISNLVITIPNGTNTGTVTFTVLNDALFENAETVNFVISNPSMGVELGFLTSQNFIIYDNDISPFVKCEIYSNEIHYDNTGTDANEFIELIGEVGASLDDWQVFLYDNTGNPYGNPINLSGTIPNTNSCMVGDRLLAPYVLDVLALSGSSIMGGPSDGWALVHSSNVVEFWSYEGTINAVSGPAIGLTSTNIGASEDGTGQTTGSIQRTDTLTWVTSTTTNTFGACNTTQYSKPCLQYTLTCPMDTIVSNCLTQSAVDAAFATWLARYSATGGTNGVLSNNNTGAPDSCGGSTTVTFYYVFDELPGGDSCMATFTVSPPPSITLTCPMNTTAAACQTQSAVDAAFATWLATATASGGCNGVLTNNNVGAPPACGGSTTVTFSYSSSCAAMPTTCQATFTVSPPPPVILICPMNTTTAACQTQTAVDAAFASWLASASGMGGCNGVLTNNNSGAPSACGGSTTVTFTYTSSCTPTTTTCQATFTVAAPPTVILTCPTNTTTAPCQTQSAVNSAFSAWLATASASGGCNGVLTNNNTGAPSACGGSTTVTFTYSSTCAPFTTTCQATFTVSPPPTVILTCPTNTTTAACQTQTAVDAAFASWLASASGMGGCNGVLTNNNTGAPSACGGSTTVTFTYSSTCAPFTTTCQSTFTVSPPPTVILTCPTNTTTGSCQTQGDVNTAFSAWLATASASGGCNGVLSNNNTGAPSICGGSTTVTFTYSSTCAPFTTTCTATFTVSAPPPVVLTCPVNTSTGSCQTQADVNTAFNAWLATASASGGCNGSLSNNNQGPPSICGGSTTVTFTYSSSCAPFTTTCTATFTVLAAPPVVLNCPSDLTISSCQTQEDVDSLFAEWLTTASGSGGCNGVLSNNSVGAPAACGGSTIVTFTYTSSCSPFTTTCQRTVTVLSNTQPISFICPQDTFLGTNPDSIFVDSEPTVLFSCGPAIIMSSNGEISRDGCFMSYQKTFTISDACSEPVTCIQTISWMDSLTILVRLEGPAEACEGDDSTYLVITEIFGGTPPYSIDYGDIIIRTDPTTCASIGVGGTYLRMTDDQIDTFLLENLTPGTYTIEILGVTDVNGCTGDPDTSVSFIIYNLPVGVDTTYELESCITDSLILDSLIQCAVPSTFEWYSVQSVGSTVPYDNPNVIGETVSPSGNGNTITDIVSNITLVPQDVIYVVIPTSVAGMCVGEPFYITKTLLPFDFSWSAVGEVNLSLDEMCMGLIEPSTLLTGPNLCDALFRVEIRYPEGTNVYEPANKVDESHVGKCLQVSVYDIVTGNSTWGTVCIEDKLGPTITMLPDTMIFCVESILPRRTGTATATDCGGVEYLDYRDHIEDYMCSPENDIAQIITRVWTAIDGMGNIATDTQIITVKYLPDSLLHAPEPLVTLSCGDDTSPAGIAAKLGDQYGYAYYIDPVNQIISPIKDGVVCNFAVSYEDGKKIEICEEGCTSSYKMFRTWTLGNWCTGEITRMMQVIKVVDTIAPIIRVESPDKVYSVDAWSCETDIVLPIARVIDNCDEHAGVVKIDGPAGTTVRYVNGRWIAEGVTKGTHELVYTAKDCCGNLSTASITVTVVDKVAPVATAKEYIVVSLTRTGQVGNDGRPSVDDGIAKVFPEMIDNGSYDNCTGVKLEVRREAGSPICLNEGTGGYNNNVTYDNTGHKEDNAKDTDGGAYVKFCCEDVGKEHKVWLRVWDDADMDGVYGSAGDNYNETWATVKVEDNSVPKLVVERDITILCDEDTSKLHLNLSDTYISVNGRVPAEWLPWVDATCDYEISYKDRGSLTTCNTGSFIRTYRVLGGKDGKVAATAEQTITIDPRSTEPYHDLPMALHLWDKCELTEEDVLANTRRAGYRLRDSLYAIEVPYYLMEWYARGHNTENGGEYCLSANNYRVIFIDYMASIGEQDDMAVSIAYEDAGSFDNKWKDIGCRVFGRKIIIDEYEVGEGCKKWLVRFEYIDWCNPEWSACLSTVYKYEDETPAEIEVTMSDTISVSADCETSWTVVPHGEDDGGCDVGFHWEVSLVRGDLGQRKFATGNDPKITFTDLYAGKYTVYYKLTDGCGNVSEKEGMLVVLGKDPTPYCINLSSAVMKNGVVELWARDFDKGSYPNCRRDTILYFTFDNAHPVWSKIDKYHYFMGDGIEVTGADTATLYLAGIAQKWIPGTKTSGKLFGCGVGDGSSFPVSKLKMTVWDAEGLSDYCEVTLSLIDSQGACGEAGVTIGGQITTPAGEAMEGVEVSLDAELAEYPRRSMTDEKGEYMFTSVAKGFDYEVKAESDRDVRNGVNTLDLVHIQRHILAIKKLDSPYKMIAADVSGDEAIRVEDLVALRKLILGVTETLGDTKSWKFVDKNQTMGNQPWPFRETMSHASLEESGTDNFVAVKMGDVDGSVKVNSTKTNTTSERNAGLAFSMDDRAVTKGEVVEIAINSENFREVYGFQMGVQMKGLEIMDVEGRGIDITKDQYAKVDKNSLRLSWSSHTAQSIRPESTIMILRLKAEQLGQLSEMISIDNSFLNSEAYTGSAITPTDIQISVARAKDLSPVLYQNTPNPWRGETTIGFDLPESGSVKLTVSDITGKIIINRTIQGIKGANRITLNKGEMGLSSGVLMYKIEYGGQTFVKKMILVD